MVLKVRQENTACVNVRVRGCKIAIKTNDCFVHSSGPLGKLSIRNDVMRPIHPQTQMQKAFASGARWEI